VVTAPRRPQPARQSNATFFCSSCKKSYIPVVGKYCPGCGEALAVGSE
jgi:predicted amidophosphoribosyltransferase